MKLDWTAIPYLKELSGRVDPSTGLKNHVQLARDLARFGPERFRDEGALIVVEVLDHDLVRRMFIASGSAATDGLLREIRSRLQSLLTPRSVLYYVGVGRFGILTPRATEELNNLLSSIRETMAKPCPVGGHMLMVDIVIGCLDIARARAQPEDALRKATAAAQSARTLSMQVLHYSASFDRTYIRNHRILHAVTAAIAENQFSLVFQPKLDTGGNISGAEALIRWKHPELGNISPAEFIPLTNDTELIVDITRWVVREAVRCIGMLAAAGLDFRISVNVSARDLADAHFAHFLLGLLAQHAIATDGIQIECTEYSALKSDRCLACLHALSDAGICIALDDFGNGYSNLASLQCLPLDKLKIDKSLIDSIVDSEHALILLESIVDLGKRLGYRLVAEGVETRDMFAVLRDMGFDELQGYAIARPMPVSELIAFCRSHAPASFAAEAVAC